MGRWLYIIHVAVQISVCLYSFWFVYDEAWLLTSLQFLLYFFSYCAAQWECSILPIYMNASQEPQVHLKVIITEAVWFKVLKTLSEFVRFMSYTVFLSTPCFKRPVTPRSVSYPAEKECFWVNPNRMNEMCQGFYTDWLAFFEKFLCRPCQTQTSQTEVLFPWGRPGLVCFHNAVLASAFQMGVVFVIQTLHWGCCQCEIADLHGFGAFLDYMKWS